MSIRPERGGTFRAVTERRHCRACRDTFTSWRTSAGQVHTVGDDGAPESECPTTDDGSHDYAVGYRVGGELVAGAADGVWWSSETGGRRVDVGDGAEAVRLARDSAHRLAGGAS